MFVELIDHFRVLLLLGEDIFGLLLHVSFVDVHEALDFVCVVLFLHRVLNVLHEVLDGMFASLRYDLRCFTLFV